MHGKYNEKVVFFEIFLHWFKCTNYSLYDMIFSPKNTTGNTIYLLYLGQLINAQRALEVHGKKHNEKVFFYKQYICSASSKGYMYLIR